MLDITKLKTGDTYYYMLTDSIHIFTITSEFKEKGFGYHRWSYYSSGKTVKDENKTMSSDKWRGSNFQKYAMNINEARLQRPAFWVIFN